MIVSINSQLLPLERAHISPLDRGFLFGDGIYEGLRAFDGRVVGMDRHIRRMQEGLDGARIPWEAAQLTPLTEALLAANNLRDAFIYWQATRGHPAPGQPVRTRLLKGPIHPTVFGYAVPTPGLAAYEPPNPPPAKSMVIVKDARWLRGQVKSISLLGSVLGAIEADEAGADDAIFVRDGLVAETTSANVILALPRRDGSTELATPSLESVPILAGVTRDLLIEAAPRHGLQIAERAIYQEELDRASEVMACGTLTMVTSIVRLGARTISAGVPGPFARRLLNVLVGAIRA